MTNAETISKLNSALTSLIKAYQELQGENSTLKQKINEQEEEILELGVANEDLEKSVNTLKNNTEEDKTTIYTMLGQIENILNKSEKDISETDSSSATQDSIVEKENSFAFNPVITDSHLNNQTNEDIKKEESNLLSNILDTSSNNDENKEKDETNNKLDLNDDRVSSLLGINQ